MKERHAAATATVALLTTLLAATSFSTDSPAYGDTNKFRVQFAADF